MNRPKTIWTSYKPLLPDAQLLRERLGSDYRIIPVTGSSPDPGLEEADIAFGQPDPQQVISLQQLRWVHVNTAGYTKYDRDDVRTALRRRGAILTSSSTVYKEPCAQHVVGMMLALARRLPQSLENQLDLHGWPMEPLRSQSVLLNGQNVLLIGYGSIARRLVELLTPFGVHIIGVRRHAKDEPGVKLVPTAQIDEHLGWADHIVNLLPASPSTEGFFAIPRFKKMKRTAFFYNIGRGVTVDQMALRVALETESLAAAYIDVTTLEPLPADDPLWTTPNCFITPHTAGGHFNEVERVIGHFLENLERLERNDQLLDRIV